MSRFFLLAVLLTASCGGAGVRNPDPLFLTHVALVESFLPAEYDALPIARGSWDALSRAPNFHPALQSVPPQFATLPTPAREEFLAGLLKSRVNDERRLGRYLRTVYLSAIYSPEFAGKVAGIDYRPARTVAVESPKLPPTWTTVDPASGELRGADIVIVGSGPAGSVLAHELRKNGRRVLLIEQGPFIMPGSVDGRVLPRLQESFGIRASIDGGVVFRNGRAVGGGTTVNVDLAFPPTLPSVRRQIESWRSAGRIRPDQFATDEMAKAYDWVKERIGTRAVSESEINANNRILWDGAKAEGLEPRLYDLNALPPGAAGLEADKKCAVRGLLLPAMTDPANPLVLLSDTTVERVVLDSEEAKGVEAIVAGKKTFIPAKVVILCAGALGSPTLLLKSGVTNPQIGRGAIAHPSIPVIGVFDREIKALEGTQASVYAGGGPIDPGCFFESMSGGPDYAALMIPGPARLVRETVASFQKLGGFGVMIIDTPGDDNRVVVDPSGKPQIAYVLSPEDRRRLKEGVARAARMMFKAGALRVILPTDEVPVLTAIDQVPLIEAQLEFIPNRTIVTSSHLQSTCKMGTDRATSVVDPDHRVWGTRNLYVVDGSIFPSSVGANPMQSIYTIARIFAERFAM